jgi:hypothetical protein
MRVRTAVLAIAYVYVAVLPGLSRACDKPEHSHKSADAAPAPVRPRIVGPLPSLGTMATVAVVVPATSKVPAPIPSR